MTNSFDAIVVGAGVVGASCAHYLVEAGLSVAVVDRGSVAAGTTGAGEGNILVSDKEPGPELDLALLSQRLWTELIDVIGPAIELEPKGGLAVGYEQHTFDHLRAFATEQAACGVVATPVTGADLLELEPNLNPEAAGGVFYPQDMQTQPMLAAAHLIARGVRMGRITLHTNANVVAIPRDARGAVTGVETTTQTLQAPLVVNAAGTWGGEIAALAGVNVPILPRRGFILVTEPLPVIVNRKVYSAEYVANVASDDAALQTAAVVEGTHSGTILIGASRERVGFDRTLDWTVVQRLAQQALQLFPRLAQASLLRTYGGFRPYCPDHLPVIGPDARVPGLMHACGHEGAGVGLSAATGFLIAQAAIGVSPLLSLAPFAAERFDAHHVAVVHA